MTRRAAEHAPDPFAAETYRLLHAFATELRATTGVGPPAAPVLLAAQILRHEHGPEAAWRCFEAAPFLRAVRASLPRARADRHKATLVAFLAFLARQGLVPDEVVRCAELAPLPTYRTDEELAEGGAAQAGG